jgi:hypothetical protein
MPGNPHGGHTLRNALDKVEILANIRPTLAVVYRGYRADGVTSRCVLISEMRKGIAPMLAQPLRRRGAIEAEIGMWKQMADSHGTASRARQPTRSLRLRAKYPQESRLPAGRLGAALRRHVCRPPAVPSRLNHATRSLKELFKAKK